jgi:DNA replication protein DnaC
MIQDGASHQEFLLGLLSDEIEYSRRARITKYLNTAGFPKRYEVGQFQPEEVIFPEETSLKSLLNLDFYRQGKNVLMYGSTGTGKTMLSILLGMEACRQGVPVRFYRTAGLINRFSESQAKQKLSVLKKKLNSAEILILDEFGYVP